MTIREIASILDGEIVGDETVEIKGLAKIEEAKAGDLTFLSNPRYKKFLETTSAAAVIVNRSMNLSEFSGLRPALIRVADAYGAFVIALRKLYPQPSTISPGVHPTAIVDRSATVGTGCSIGPYVVIGPEAAVGENTVIHASSSVGPKARIGRDCLIYPGVSIREECVIGDRVIIQPGAIIGSDGFGFAPRKDGTYQKIPQMGIVVLEDDVEIGANTCIDRATMGETRVAKGTKLDNLVQVAHNVVIGRNVVIAGTAGIAGSAKIGDGVMIGGNTSINGHITIAKNVGIGGHTAVMQSIKKEGGSYFGVTAKEVTQALRVELASRQLPDLLITVRKLEEKVRELEATIEELKKNK